MRVLHEDEIAGRKVVIRELTVGEIRAWLEIKGAETPDLIDSFLSEEMALSDIVQMCDLTITDLDGFTPTEIEQVIVKCKEVNARFFAMRGRLAEVGQKILANSQASAPAI